MVVRHGLADDLAFRLGQALGGIVDSVNGFRVQSEGDFAECHIDTIPLPYMLPGNHSLTVVAPNRSRARQQAVRNE